MNKKLSIDEKLTYLNILLAHKHLSRGNAIALTGEDKSFGYKMLNLRRMHKFVDTCIDRVEQKYGALE